MSVATFLHAPPTADAAVPARDPAGFIPHVQALGRGATLRRDLTRTEACDALDRILGSSATEAQTGAFLIAQRVKGECAAEISGFADAVRQRWMEPVPHSVSPLLDLAVPYDGKERTAQLVPAVALTLAACGLPVMLHGDENVPTKAGITVGAVLDQLGIATDLSPAEAGFRLEADGVAYCGAARFMPAWHDLLPTRWEFGLRTVLNTIEKLVNPANAEWQVTGFYHTKYIDHVRAAQTGGQASWIVQGEEGSIEMRSGRKTRIYGRSANETVVLDPEALGFARRVAVEPDPVPAAHAVLNGQAVNDEDCPAKDQVALTTGVILSLFGNAPDIPSGIEAARLALASGRANAILQSMSS